MARIGRGQTGKRLRYFYLDGKLYKTLYINRAGDLVSCWDYADGKQKMFVWSEVQKRHKKAFTITQTAKLLNKNRFVIDKYVLRWDAIKKPQRAYNINTKEPGTYYLSEDDVLDLHTMFLETHIGRPRLDHKVSPGKHLPTRADLLKLMGHGQIVYTKTTDGEFVPIYKEQIW